MTVRGKVNFNVNRILPSPSCLFVTLADVSLMDAPSTVIKSQRFDLSNFDTSVGFFEYELTTKRPAQLWRSHSLSATLHAGRCPEKRQSITIGDILTDTTHSIELTKSKTEYTKDINTICYGRSTILSHKRAKKFNILYL